LAVRFGYSIGFGFENDWLKLSTKPTAAAAAAGLVDSVDENRIEMKGGN